MCKNKASTFLPGLRQLFAVPAAGAYEYWLRQATQRLRDSFFGNWQGTDSDGLPNFLKDKFDHTYWEWVSDPKFIRVLHLIAGKTPAEAIDAVLDGLTAWRIDCDHTVQISNLYALRKVLGAEQFNARMGGNMLLRDRESTGLTTVAHYGREGPGDAWRVVTNFDPKKVKSGPQVPDTDGHLQESKLQLSGPFEFAPGAPLAETTEQLVARARAGSRVRWTNLDARLSDAFRHENCVKLGPDLFAAGGLDDPITGNEFTGERVAIELALITNPAPTKQYIQGVIYIDEIEEFDQH
jgi:hypothetical protein